MGKLAVLRALLVAALVAGCNTVPLKPTYLRPYATPADATPVIRHVEPNSPAQSAVQVGDLVLSVDAKPIGSTMEFYSALLPTPRNVHVRTKAGEEKDVPFSVFVKPDSHEMWAWLIEPGQSISFELNNPVYGEHQEAALVYPRNAVALVSASLWTTDPQYIEVYLELRVNADCQDCKLENIAVLDISRNSWLTPVRPEHVAWALYPTAGQAPGLVSVPPPTPVGYTATGIQTGTLSARTYGSSTYGTYSGSGVSTVAPQYDYTLTNMALISNLSSMIQADKIRAHGAARDAFINRRQSNLRVGALNPGERVTGYVHFHLPDGFDGPFFVAVNAGKFAGARFDPPLRQHVVAPGGQKNGAAVSGGARRP